MYCLWSFAPYNDRNEQFHVVRSINSKTFTIWQKKFANLCSKLNSQLFSFFYFVKSSSSVTQLYPTLCNPMDCSTSDFPVHHQLQEPTQTHIHWVSDANQPSHPLPFPSPLASNLSQHQGLFKWVSSSHQVVRVLEFQLQHQSFQWIFRTDLLKDGLVRSPCCPRDSQESSSTPQFKSISSLVLIFLYSPILTTIHVYWKNHSFD